MTLRAELARLGLTQGQAARLLGATDRTVRAWIAKDDPPKAVMFMVSRLSPEDEEVKEVKR